MANFNRLHHPLYRELHSKRSLSPVGGKLMERKRGEEKVTGRPRSFSLLVESMPHHARRFRLDGSVSETRFEILHPALKRILTTASQCPTCSLPK